MSAALLATISGALFVDEVWGDEWHVLAVSLQVSLARWSLWGSRFGLKRPRTA